MQPQTPPKPDGNAPKLPTKRLAAAGLALMLVAVVTLPGIFGSAAADHSPADKVAVAGSTLEVMTSETGPGSGLTSEDTSTVTLMTGTIKTSNPTDLIIQVTAECALFTDIKTVGNDNSRSRAQVTVWVELDGEPIGVVSGDDGRVVFCDRDDQMITSQLENENATLEQYLHTRSANAFNWITLNTGNGEHTLEVKAQLDVVVEGKGEAKAIVGKRTLVVEPVKMANHASI